MTASGKKFTIRFESKKQLEDIRRAANAEDRSVNSFIVREVTKAAEQAMRQKEQVATPA